jgi:NAD(P)H-flavin reductase
LSIQGAGLGVVPGTRSLAGIMQQQRKIKDIWILQLAKKLLILQELRILGIDEFVKFLNTD